MSAASFVVILPVKPPALGKSRLRGLPDAQRRDLAAAFARDTAAAARRTPGVVAVLAVTDDFSFASELAEDGCEVIPDGVSQDLNATLRQAAAEAERRWPGAVPVTLCADLPALVPDDLAAALREVAGPTFVRTPPAPARPCTPHPPTGSRRASVPGRPPATSRRARTRWPHRPPPCASTSTTSATSAAPWCSGVGPHTAHAMSGGTPGRARERRATRGVTRRLDAVRLGLLGGRLLGGRLLGRRRRRRLGGGAFFAVACRGRLRGRRLRSGRLGGVDFAAVVFVAVFLAGAFFAGAFLAAGLLGRRRLGRRRLLAAVFLAAAFFAGAFLAVVFLAACDFSAVFAPGSHAWRRTPPCRRPPWPCRRRPPATARTVGGLGIVAAVSFGSFLAPETTFLRSWPACELRHRLLLGLHPLAGLRVADPAGVADASSRRSRSR